MTLDCFSFFLSDIMFFLVKNLDRNEANINFEQLNAIIVSLSFKSKAQSG